MKGERKRGLTLSEVLKLPRTHCSTVRSWLHLAHTGEILITNQRPGNESTGHVRLTRAEFEKFCDFYDKALKLAREVRR